MPDTIDGQGYPLAFKVRQGSARSPLLSNGRDTIKVEARQLAHHQKEAIVTGGANASAWRLPSDEGVHLKGTDLAPFPLGFFNAGMQSDLYGRIRALAPMRGITLDDVHIRLVNHYWLTGSFIQGTGEGHAEPPDLDVSVKSSASNAAVEALVSEAIDASPAFAFLRTALTANTFALYINGRRRPVEGVANSSAPDAADPYRMHASAPRPLDASSSPDFIAKTGRQQDGASQPAANTIQGKQLRNIFGDGAPRGADGFYATDTWLEMPGASHFSLTSDEGGADAAPSGLALFSAGITFCYMTQLSRYIENMKMAIRGVRIVQYNPFVAGANARAEPIDTHLFLNGEAPDEIHLQLLTVAARTCYLHACAKAPLEPIVRVIHNGTPIARAA